MIEQTWKGLMKVVGLLAILVLFDIVIGPSVASRLGGTLYASAKKNDASSVSYVLEKRKWMLGQPSWGIFLMHIAAEYDSPDVISIALKHGYRTQLNYYSDRLTPLHVAMRYNSLNAAVLLLNRGADVNAIDQHGMTPVYYAHDKVLIDKIIEKGAKLNHRAYYGSTPLMYGASENNPILVTALLERKVDTSVRDMDGKSALDLAINRNNVEIVTILTEYQRQSSEQKEMSVKDEH